MSVSKKPTMTKDNMREWVLYANRGNLSGTRTGTNNDDTISCEVAKSLQPTCAIVLECIPLEKSHVESVPVIDKFLMVLQGNLGNEGRAPQVLEMPIEAVGPEANDNVVFVGYISHRSGNTISQRDRG
jgi:hypothetical protein